MNSIVIIIVAITAVVVLAMVLKTRLDLISGGKSKKSSRPGNGFLVLQQRDGFMDAGKDLGETTALFNAFDGQHLSATDFKETIKKVKKCVKKEEPHGGVYLGRLLK